MVYKLGRKNNMIILIDKLSCLWGLNDVKISTLTNLKLFNRLLKQKWLFGNVINYPHCVKIVQIRSFFWSVFSRIRTEYGEILHISLYSIQMRENTDQQKPRVWTLFMQYLHCLAFSVKWIYHPYELEV